MPPDVVDFSSYLPTLKPADCTVMWIIAGGAPAFVKQYHDYGIKAPLIVEMAHTLQEPALKDLGDAGLNLIATDNYVPLLDNPLNKKFVGDYTKQWNGEQPNADSFGGWLAVNVFLEGVKKSNGDTSPKALIAALSTVSLDSPAGKYSFSAYQNAYIGIGDFHVCKSVKIGDRTAWQPIYTYKQVKFESKGE